MGEKPQNTLDINNYPFRPAEQGWEACRLTFRFHEAAAPRTWVRAYVIRQEPAGDKTLYKIGVINPEIPGIEEDDGVIYHFYPCDAAKFLLDLPSHAPQTEDGYLGLFTREQVNEMLGTLQQLSNLIYLNHEKHRQHEFGGSAQPAPRLM